MGLLIHQLLLLASIAALSAAGWRLASAAVPTGLMRVLATVAFAAAGAVLSALALALVGLGASPVALALAALVLWAVTWRAAPLRPPSAAEQLGGWWSGLTRPGRVARLAVVGAALGYGTWVLRYPGLGYDALTYHLALPVAWIHNGRPGSLATVWDNLPIQNYPVTWEVLITWATAISRTFVPPTLLTPAMLLLLGASVRAGLAELGVSPRMAWLATATACTLPLVVVQLPGPNNDLPDSAWLACAAALAAGAAPWRAGEKGASRERHPALLAAALVAVGLCVGTKTTGAPLAVVALAAGAWRCRDQLRRLLIPLLLAAAAAAVVGGVWYVRNLVQHGSPFWPLSTTPWGDPIPAAFRSLDASLLSKLHATLHGRLDDYWRALAGGVVVVAAALVAPLWARRRVVVGFAVVVLGSLALWAASPYTGDASSTTLAVGATRYLLPCLLAAVATVALAGRGGGRHELLPAAALVAALVINLDHDVSLGFPYAPSARLLLVSAGLGALMAVVLELVARWVVGGAWWGAPALAAVVAAVLLVALLVPVDGYLAAHARTGQFDAGLVRWLDSRPAYRNGSAPVLVGPVSVAVLAGARLSHPVTVLGADDPCPALAREARGAWVVMELGAVDYRYDRHWIACLAGQRPTAIAAGFLIYAPPRA
ncbi:MAG TPA: hypothetical protein VG295_04685 [Solirubrobacteraceae bacterium]|nr:hypothetical protein [Solirubrobacteraceae bacterium]